MQRKQHDRTNTTQSPYFKTNGTIQGINALGEIDVIDGLQKVSKIGGVDGDVSFGKRVCLLFV